MRMIPNIKHWRFQKIFGFDGVCESGYSGESCELVNLEILVNLLILVILANLVNLAIPANLVKQWLLMNLEILVNLVNLVDSE